MGAGRRASNPRIGGPRIVRSKGNIALSRRCLAVLRWAAIGRTGAETSEIVRISERTVSFHAANARRKFDAPNSLSATTAAALLGLLW